MQIKMVKEGMTTIINHNVAAINNVAAISSAAVTSKVVAISNKVATRNAHNASKVHAHKCALCHVLSQ